MTRILVTGARGYIGGAIARELAASGYAVHGGIRQDATLPAGITPFVTGDLATAEPDLRGFDAVLHAAGLGHRRGVTPDVWQRENSQAAANIARRARSAGVPRFVLISTAHVHGRVHDGVVHDETPVNPMDAYAASKRQAEIQVTAEFGSGLTLLRPVAVIGPHCPGNLQLLMKLLHRGLPLPFGAIANQRSFIAIGDLARLAVLVLQHAAPPKLILASGTEAIATPTLIRALAEGMGVSARLPQIPLSLLRATAAAAGRTAMWQSLAGNFITSPRCALALGWTPRKTLTENLVETGQAYAVT